MTISFFALVTKDLDAILKQLELFPKSKWEEFGIKAGIYSAKLRDIEANHSNDCEKCFRECLFLWLERADKVDEKGMPTWLKLVGIFEEMGYKALADEIRNNKGQNNNVLCI